MPVSVPQSLQSALPALLPSARLLAATLLGVATALQFDGRLPGQAWLAPMLLALPVVVLAGWWAHRQGKWWLLPAGHAGLALLAVCAMLHWRVHDALDSRLPPSLEGLDLQVTGVVDAMPQRFDFGDRVRFSLSSCRIAVEADEVLGGSLPVAGDCGGLDRIQLDWGPLREKDRAARGSDAEAAGGDDEGGTEAGDRYRAGQGPAGDPLQATWPQPGQYWRLTVRLKRPVAPANPGGFDLELRYLQQGIGALGRVYARQLLPAPPTLLARLDGSPVIIAFESWRTWLRDRLEAVYVHRVDPPAAGGVTRWAQLGVVAGLALGDQAAISPRLWGLFSRTGVSHLMAISGMHVTMLALAAAWLVGRVLKALTRSKIPALARLLGRQPRQQLVLLVAVLSAFGYALLSGWGIPSQRTCWMLTAAAVMSLSGRGRGAMDITLLSAAVVVLMDPWAVSSAGFWLSFGAVAAILWCAHGQDTQRAIRMSLIGIGSSRLPAGVRDAVTSQWAATIGLAPLVIALFSTLSLIGPVANAVAIPWVSLVITPLAVAAALLAPFFEPLAALLLQLTLWMIEHLISMLSLLDRLPAASAVISRPGGWTLAAACLGAAVMIAPAGVPMRPAGALCLLPMLFAPPQLPADDELWISVLDIGQGSSVLVEAGRQRLLFDTGPGSDPDRSAVSRFLLPYLRSRGIESIDTLVVSHLEVEHAGGAAAVLQALQPARLLTSFDVRLLPADTAALSGPRRLRCTTGQVLDIGAASIRILHPAAFASERNAARGNASSCVMRIAAAAGSVLLTGDLPATSDSSLLASSAPEDLRADVLLVPQQGSRNAASPQLLAAVKPSVAILQLGYRNRYRHPHPSVLQRLSAIPAVVLRTDHDGAVQVRLSPRGKPRVLRMRRDTPPYWRVDAAAQTTVPSSRRRWPRPRRAPGPLPASTGRQPARRSAPA